MIKDLTEFVNTNALVTMVCVFFICWMIVRVAQAMFIHRQACQDDCEDEEETK